MAPKLEVTVSFTDLIQGIFKLYLSSEKNPVNLGNPDERTVMQVANLLKTLSGSLSLIQSTPGREDDPKKRKPDITRATEILKWQPRVSLEDGLKSTLEYFKKSL